MEEYRIDSQSGHIYPMGITKIEGGIHICVEARGKECRLFLYQRGKEQPCSIIPFPEDGRLGNVWSMTLYGNDFTGLEYCFEIDGIKEPDPYGRLFTGRDEWGKLEQADQLMRSPVLIDDFDWEGDKPLQIPFRDSIIYRIHTRGFTKHPSSGVRDKGTFKAVREKIPYFQELGINAVELLPITEFQEIIMPGGVDGNPYGLEKPTGKLNYWGYGPGYYFAPKASYSAGKVKNPIAELKLLVKELHKAGIEVIAEMYFSGQENASFVLDAVRYWVMEYHLDGIHLVGSLPAGLVGDDPYLAETKLFATSWEGSFHQGNRHLAEYNDGFMVDMRRVLKGDEDQMNNLIFRSRRNPRGCAVINYMANTNGFTMMDMVSYDIKHNEANGEGNQDGNAYNYSWNCGVEGITKKKKILEIRSRQIRNAVLLLFLSQGTPLLLSGDEFGNSKGGNNNSYCQDNEVSWLNWNQLKSRNDIFEFVKHVIAFRRTHPVFHMEYEPRIMDYLACGHPDISYHGVKAWCPEFENYRRQMGIMYCGEYGLRPDGLPDDYFFVAYNMHWEPHEFALPNLPKKMTWRVAMNTDAKEVNGFYEEGQEPVTENQKQFIVPPRTVVVFIGRKGSSTAANQ